jgi:acylphosphatase
MRVRIRGRVQGVFFREEARRRAQSLGVGGWIRNLPDGSVEAVFDGEQERVQSMVDWSGRGPTGALVEGLEAAQEPPTGERDFEVR